MPHWTHFVSMKRSCGVSGLSRIAAFRAGADAGEAHRAARRGRPRCAPNGAPAGSAMTSSAAPARAPRDGRARDRAPCACRRRARTSPRCAARARRGHDHSAALQRAGAGAVDQAEMLALVAERVGDRLADRHLEAQRVAVLGRLACRSPAPRRPTRPRRAPQSHVSSPADATWWTSTGITRAGSPRPRRASVRDRVAAVRSVQQQAGVAPARPRRRSRAACEGARRSRRGAGYA